METITVKVGKLPGRIVELALEKGSVVAVALETAELNPEGFEVRVNGAPTDMNKELTNMDTILLVKKIIGNF